MSILANLRGLVLTSLVIAAGVPATTSARAATRTYTLTPAQSSISLSGNVTTSFGSAPIQPQGTGSLTTTYAGTILADRTDTTIQFLPGGSIDANVNGDWQPLPDASSGAAPADYGARVSYLGGLVVVNFAGRDLVANLTGDATPVDASGNFSLANSTVNFTSGTVSYRGPLGNPAGSETLAGTSGDLDGNAILTVESVGNDLIERLILPVDATFLIPIDDTTSVNLTLTGQLTATSLLSTVLPGDFNQNGAVDAADYVTWRKGTGVETTEDNYNLWRTNFGRTTGEAFLGGTPSAAPEPASVVTTIVCFGAIFWNTRRLGRTT